MLRLRPAMKVDAPAIRRLIWQAHINPMSLNWKRFTVAINEQNQVIGCAQIKPHYDGTFELASIAVQPEQRCRGIARALIEHLLTDSPRPLYLTCRSSLQPLYEKFGFRVVSLPEMTPYFHRLWHFVRLLTFLSRRAETMLVMVLD
jgi:N-acetylglutamate synthase-like GNAT family acetyltransferase